MHKYYNNFFGTYGGRYVAEILRTPLDELENAYKKAITDKGFLEEYAEAARNYIGRPTPLLYAQNTTEELGG